MQLMLGLHLCFGGLTPLFHPHTNEIPTNPGRMLMPAMWPRLYRCFKLQNSWGPGWGDRGYFYVPYRYILDYRLNIFDMWIFND